MKIIPVFVYMYRLAATCDLVHSSQFQLLVMLINPSLQPSPFLLTLRSLIQLYSPEDCAVSSPAGPS